MNFISLLAPSNIRTTTDYTDRPDGFETDSIRANPGLIRGKKFQGSGSVAAVQRQAIRGQNALYG